MAEATGIDDNEDEEEDCDGIDMGWLDRRPVIDCDGRIADSGGSVFTLTGNLLGEAEGDGAGEVVAAEGGAAGGLASAAGCLRRTPRDGTLGTNSI